VQKYRGTAAYIPSHVSSTQQSSFQFLSGSMCRTRHSNIARQSAPKRGAATENRRVASTVGDRRRLRLSRAVSSGQAGACNWSRSADQVRWSRWLLSCTSAVLSWVLGDIVIGYHSQYCDTA